MNAPDPRRVEEVFDGAAGLAPDAIGPYLDAACAGDSALREEVLALLEADKHANDRAPERIAARAVLADAEAETVLERDADARAPAPGTPAAPRALGPFEVVRKLGEGGMGVVYEAYDARLDRRVAVKLVRVGQGGSSSPLARTRLLKEARALAKVRHPNVVAIHEVGVVGDEVFIVMELVEGEALGTWLRREPRSWRDVLAKYVAAGRGLEAAHAAGVVHRDFKPENVLVGEDGRPRVVDFGLARTGEGAPASSPEMGPASSRPQPRAASIDHTYGGTIVGTPSYMSPEHFRGAAIDPRSDQFSFAVALYRGLFDAAPFAGKDLAELRESVLSCAPAPPTTSDVPPPVIEALLRALAPDPAERFPSMHELLVVLEGALATSADLDPSTSRTKRRIAAAVLTLTAAATAVPVGDGPPVASTAGGLLALGFVALATLVVLGIVFRRMLVDSAYNRRVAALFLVPVLGFIVHRALAVRLGSRVEDILVADAVSMAAVLAFAALTMERWMGIPALLAVAYAAVATGFPSWAAPGFGSLLCLSAAVPVIWWRTPRPRRRRGRSGSEKKIGSRVGSGSGSAD